MARGAWVYVLDSDVCCMSSSGIIALWKKQVSWPKVSMLIFL